MAELVDEFRYLNSSIETDFERAVLEAPSALRASRWYGDWSLREIVLHLATWDEMDAQFLEAIAQGELDPKRRWSGPQETDSLNAELIAEHAGKDWDAVTTYASESLLRLRGAVDGLRALPVERFWDASTGLRGRAMHSATHRIHHLLPILEWTASLEDSDAD